MTGVAVRQRPSVVGDDLRRFVSLTWTLAITEFKLRFYGSVLGYVWTLARPFMFFGVIYFVFAVVANFGDAIRFYPVYILTGMVLFQFFGGAVTGCVTCLLNRENLLRKMRFPRMVIPLSVVVSELLNLAGTLIAVFIFALVAGVRPHWTWLELPLLIVVLIALGTGVGMLLAALYVRYRDMQPIWEVGQQALFYASPILYVAASLPDSVERVFLFNPIAAVLTQMRHAVLDPQAPTAAAAIGGTVWLLIPAGITVALFAVGLKVFSAEAPRVAENL